MLDTVCFFHDDLDGRAAAAIVLHANPNAKCIAANYEKPLPVGEATGKIVFIVDFTPTSKDQFDAIVENAERVIWLDHHKTNIDKYPEYTDLAGKRVANKPSGAMLTWGYCHPAEPPPPAVQLVSDFDTWTFAYNISLSFHDGMESLDCSPESDVWNSLLVNPDWTNPMFAGRFEKKAPWTVDDIVKRGQAIRDFLTIQSSENLARFGWTTTFEGREAVVCCTQDRGSMFFDSVDGFDLMLSYCHNGEQFTVGVYSRNKDIHCGELAKKYGGGGHHSAAGFACKELPFKFLKPLNKE